MAKNDVSKQQPVDTWGSLLVELVTTAMNEMLTEALWETLSQKQPG